MKQKKTFRKKFKQVQTLVLQHQHNRDNKSNDLKWQVCI